MPVHLEHQQPVMGRGRTVPMIAELGVMTVMLIMTDNVCHCVAVVSVIFISEMMYLFHFSQTDTPHRP